MNNLKLFTSEKLIDHQSTSKLRAVLLKISLQKMKASEFKFCQYVFQSYNESLDQTVKIEDFSVKEESVLEINSRSKVFDQDLLAHVLWYLKITQSNFERNTSIKMNKNEDILNLAITLFKFSKNLEHKNIGEDKISL